MKAVETALYSLLSGNSALTTALGGSFVYNRVVPQGQARPYVVFFHAGGGPDNVYPGRLQSDVYMVKAVADSLSQSATLDGLIDAALHHKESGLTVTGYTTLWCVRETEVQMAERADNGDVIWHYGAYYRIRIDK